MLKMYETMIKMIIIYNKNLLTKTIYKLMSVIIFNLKYINDKYDLLYNLV